MKTRKIILIVFLLFSVNIFSQNFIRQPAEKLFDYIIVEKSNFDFKNDKEFNKKTEYIDGLKLMKQFGSWDKFPSNDTMFNSISIENVEDNWIKFKDKIIDLCKVKNLDHISLTKCLEIVKDRNDDKALLPIAAYQCKNRDHSVWVIVCLWENMRLINYFKENDQIFFWHIRQYAIDVINFEIIAFETCG